MTRTTHDTDDYGRITHEDVFALFVGATIATVSELTRGDDLLRVSTSHGDLVFYHRQDCCESVYLVDGADDLQALVGQQIAAITEVSSDDEAAPDSAESYTWTFYNIETAQGTAQLRFLGESNGYYSESVDARREITE